MTVTLFAGHIPTHTGKRHRDQVVDDIGIEYVTDPTLEFRKEGCFRNRYTNPDAKPTFENPLVSTEVVAEFIETDDIWISPLLGDLVVGDLQDNFSFGNGSTGPVLITKIRDGVSIPVKIVVCCFPQGTTFTDEQLYRMQEIFEGIPPGTPS